MATAFEHRLVPGAIVVFGELHGTAEVPAFVGRTLDQPHPVVLGLEWPAELQAAVDGFIAGATTRAALVEALNAGAFPDGRTSEAMVALIDRARSLRAERRDLRIVCFDRWPESGDRDEAMACALLAAFDPRAVSFVLCGNIHARTSSPEYMGWHLRARHDQLLALNLEHAGGTAWCIVRDRKPGVVEFPRRPDLPPSSPLGVRLYELRDDDGYDGELVVGQITASPLARAEL